ncbi:MAG: ArnT family glycosyltransferase, partial [Candidatus Binatia bacterium]
MRIDSAGRTASIGAAWGAALAACAYVAAMWAWHGSIDAFELNPDEGINAMKALLVAHGHPLYVEVWSDQPPLFTHLLRAWFDLVGWDLVAGRGLVLLCAGLIVFTVTDMVRQAAGRLAGLAAAVILCTDAYFQAFSISLMIGVPALALALLGLWMVRRWHGERRPAWLLCSGACLGAALGIKLIAALLVPIAFVALAVEARAWRPLGLWCTGLAAALLGTAALIGGAGWSQLSTPRLDGWAAFGSAGAASVLRQTLRADWTLLVLAALGLGAARRPGLLTFAVWLAVATPLLAGHTPYWAHHYVLLVLPLCALAGAAVGLANGRRWPWQAAAAVGIAAVVALRLNGWQPQPWLPRPGERTGHFVVELMRQFADRTTRVFADRAVFAFRAGFEVPPALAVISVKRFASGALSPAALVQTLADDPPEQIVLTDRLPPAALEGIAPLLADRYQPMFERREPALVQLFVRRDVAGDPLDALRAAAARVPDSAAAYDQMGMR